MIRLTFCLALLPIVAEAQGLRDRIEALTPPPDPYAAEKASDLARISAEPRLFPDGEAIAVFIGPDCPDCAQALAELQDLADRHGVTVQVLDTAQPDDAALMARLSLDMLPSYVMPDRLIRGQMPIFVLERYLTR